MLRSRENDLTQWAAGLHTPLIKLKSEVNPNDFDKFKTKRQKKKRPTKPPKEFVKLIQQPDAARVLQDVGVDVVSWSHLASYPGRDEVRLEISTTLTSCTTLMCSCFFSFVFSFISFVLLVSPRFSSFFLVSPRFSSFSSDRYSIQVGLFDFVSVIFPTLDAKLTFQDLMQVRFCMFVDPKRCMCFFFKLDLRGFFSCRWCCPFVATTQPRLLGDLKR